jgi:two-component system, NarL family, sensor kinase
MVVRALTPTSPVLRFLLGSLAAMLVVVAGLFFALRSITISDAERDTRERVTIEGQLVQSAGLTDGILRRDPKALAKLDDLVQGQILSDSVVRVKLWSRDGRILYSDEPALIGHKYGLGDEEQELFETGGADAEISDLTKPENRYERQEGKLLEAHTPIRTPDGTPVLFEIYQRFGSISASAARLLRQLVLPLAAGLLVLLLLQLPLAASLARRLQRGHEERERLLTNAIEASDRERRRIAADLHDGVVQDLAGVAFGLAPLAEDAAKRGATGEASALRDAIARLRQGVREMRTLLVAIHPPSLKTTGIEAALHDLLSPLEAEGIATDLHVTDGSGACRQGSPAPGYSPSADPLVYRVAREALRNVQEHADAHNVRVEVSHPTAGTTRLVVADDGRGFAAADRARRGEEGHVGLTLLEDLVRDARGTLAVTSAPGAGTTVELELPA